MRRLLLLIAIALMLFSCEKFQVASNSDNVVKVKTDDQEMNEIISNAQSSVSTFLENLKHPKPTQRDFSVKYPFPTDPGSTSDTEHIWLDNIKQKGNQYYGRVANDPYSIKNMKLGDVVGFDPNKVSDWKYVENDVLVGGKSIIFLIKNISKEERAQVLKEIDYKIPEFSDYNANK